MSPVTPPTNGSEPSRPAAFFVADLFLEALAEAGVDYLFTVLGSDHPTVIEAYVRRQNAGKTFPKMLLFQHEFVAMSAADAYGRVTGRAQCIIVHVDVGTAALGQGLHNASSGKAPVLIFSGQAPLTLYGELPGSRSEHVQWYQDVHGQHNLVAPYSRYSNEIKVAEHTKLLVRRALMMANTGNPGPTYLTATREAFATPVVDAAHLHRQLPAPSAKLGGLHPDDVIILGDALLSADRPLVVTGYIGRNHSAVRHLVTLANQIKGLRVFDFEFREMSFPADHLAWISRATGAAPAIKTADVILVLDADVPWIPTKVKPSDSARIYHVDLDARKDQMTQFDIRATATFTADTATVLQQLNTYIGSHEKLGSLADGFATRWESLKKSHAEGQRTLAARATPNADGTLNVNHLFSALREVLPRDTIYVNDVVTNQVPLSEQLQLVHPGTNLTKGGSGLGWAGGAAIGVKLATELYDISDRPNIKRRSPPPSPTATKNPTTSATAAPGTPLASLPSNSSDEDAKATAPSSSSPPPTITITTTTKPPLICSLTGDGSFLFSAPSSVYWAQHRLHTPFLSIIVNNGGWKATRSCINDVHPGGLASELTDQGLGIDLKDDGPDYLGICLAAAGGGDRMFVRKVERGDEVEAALREALAWMEKEGKGAVLEMAVS